MWTYKQDLCKMPQPEKPLDAWSAEFLLPAHTVCENLSCTEAVDEDSMNNIYRFKPLDWKRTCLMLGGTKFNSWQGVTFSTLPPTTDPCYTVNFTPLWETHGDKTEGFCVSWPGSYLCMVFWSVSTLFWHRSSVLLVMFTLIESIHTLSEERGEEKQYILLY